MKKNIAKEKIKNGIPSIGTWVSSGNPLVCETLATSGIDWINIECEHSSIDLGSWFTVLGQLSTQIFLSL